MIYTMLLDSLMETLYMVSVSIALAMVFGLPLGVFLSITKKGGILEMENVNKILGAIVNIVRSFPFIILIILLLPLSRLIVGTSVGSTTAIIPLSVSATPFIARLFEGAFDEVPKGLIEASKSLGASRIMIVKMMISESLPGIINAIVITSVSLIGYSAMAGAVGAGGLGDLAIRIGYQTYRPDILLYAVISIIVLVQIIQSSGEFVVNKLRAYR